MRSLKVVQIIVKDNRIMGLSEEGHLIHFNETIGQWERRSNPEILEPGQSEKLMCSVIRDVSSGVTTAMLEDKPRLKIKPWMFAFAGMLFTILLLATIIYFIIPLRYL